jgi:hypothetical protein
MSVKSKKKYINLFDELSKTESNFCVGDQFLIRIKQNSIFDSFYCYKVEETEDKIIYYFNN